MKVISAHSKKIARVLCNCCREDHYFDISLNTDYGKPPASEDEYLLEIEFDSNNVRYMGFSERFRCFRNLLKNKDNGLFEETVDSVLVTLDQLKEIKEIIYHTMSRFLSPEELDIIHKPPKPNVIKKEVIPGWEDIYFFRGKDGLAFYLDNYSTKRGRKFPISEGGIGWFYTEYETKRDIRRNAWRLLLKKSNYGVRNYWASLTKSETVRFLSVICYIFDNIETDKNGDPWLEI